MVGRSEPDDLCPACGVPLPAARHAAVCPHCGAELSSAGGACQAKGYLTPFGYGMCGLIAGGHLGLAAVLVVGDVHLGDPRVVLFPAAGGLACAWLAAQLGSRLHVGVRAGYETVLLGLMVAALVVFVTAVGGVTALDTLVAVGAVAFVLATPLIRRALAPPHGGDGGHSPASQSRAAGWTRPFRPGP